LGSGSAKRRGSRSGSRGSGSDGSGQRRVGEEEEEATNSESQHRQHQGGVEVPTRGTETKPTLAASAAAHWSPPPVSHEVGLRDLSSEGEEEKRQGGYYL